MKKFLCIAISVMLIVLTGCASKSGSTISVISREDGSGTRGAFIELFGIEQKDADGNKTDQTSEKAEITSSTAVMMTTIAENENAIGYISLGSLNETVKALTIDGTQASADHIKDGTYQISRPFNVVTKGELNPVAKDFMSFILSHDGQKVVEVNHYISRNEKENFTSAKPAGKAVVAGSSSVSPLMEKLIEAYEDRNPNAKIELQQSDSTTGISSAAEGLCDIGMASRDLKESEQSKGLTAAVIAMDGIAVIVNKGNEVSALTSDQVRQIFTGELTDWNQIK